MEPEKPFLSDNEEWRLLIDIIDSCHAVDGAVRFHQTVYPRLRELLPHDFFMYGHTDLSQGRVLRSVNISFPQEFIEQSFTAAGDLDCPLVRQWIRKRAPVHFQPAAARSAASDSPKLQAFADLNIGGIVVHGVVDGTRAAASCYAFGGVENPGSPRTEAILRWVTPHLHAALTSPELASRVPALAAPLSSREREVLMKVAQGKTDAEIATEFAVSVCTIRTHMRNIIQKLGAANRTHAVIQALYRGFVNV